MKQASVKKASSSKEEDKKEDEEKKEKPKKNVTINVQPVEGSGYVPPPPRNLNNPYETPTKDAISGEPQSVGQLYDSQTDTCKLP